MAKHLITFGHLPGADPGAIANGMTEAVEIRRLEPYLKKWAKKSKDQFVFYQGDLYADRAMYKQTGYDSVTELHLDGPQGDGGHVIIFRGYQPDAMDKRLAKVIEEHFGIVSYLQSEYGFSYRNNLYNINQSARYGINYRLLELFFLANWEDYNYYINNLDLVAKDIIEGITGENLSSKPIATKPVKPAQSAPKPTPKKDTVKTLHLPAGAKSWRIYKPEGPYVANGKGQLPNRLNPAKYGGLKYEIKGNPMKDVYLIDTSDFGRVAIYAGPNTGARITGTTQNVTKQKAKKLHLPAVDRWRVYNVNGPYTVGNEVGFLLPKKYAPLSYTIRGQVAPHVYIIQTRDLDRVAIYAHPTTGATIK